MGSKVGVTEAQLRDLSRYTASPAFNARERLVLDLAVAMARTPADISDDLRARLRRAFKEDQIVELTAAIAWEHYRSRFNRVFGVQPVGFHQDGFCPLPERLPDP